MKHPTELTPHAPHCDRDDDGGGGGGSGTTDGERRKRDALERLSAIRAGIVRRGQRVLLETIMRNGTATADDVANAIELPPGIDGRCLGAIPGALARVGIIECTGYVKSSRPSRHASILAIWQLADADAMREWFAMNPAPPDDDELPTCVMKHDPPKTPTPAAATVGVGMEAM